MPPETVSVVVTETGHISALDKDGTSLAETDIELYRFQNPAGLTAIGRNFYRESEASGDAVAGTPGDENYGTIAQGYLEGSNVEMVDEMVGLIVGQRAYEINSKAHHYFRRHVADRHQYQALGLIQQPRRRQP